MRIVYWVKKIAARFLSMRCPLCGMTSHHAGCCHACENALPWLNQVCARCGLSLVSDLSVCGKCLQHPPIYDNTIALFRYDSPVDHLILSIKFSKNLVHARILGEMMSEKFRAYYANSPLPDLILPVPLHHQRLRERGFNQAVEIARPIAKKFKIPLSLHDCMRLIETKPQATVSAQKRKRNIKKAFGLRRPLNVDHVVILDDVVTTGSTVNELAVLLKREGGVKRVDVWCCARTLSLAPSSRA